MFLFFFRFSFIYFDFLNSYLSNILNQFFIKKERKKKLKFSCVFFFVFTFNGKKSNEWRKKKEKLVPFFVACFFFAF